MRGITASIDGKTLEILEHEIPFIDDQEVLVKVHYSGVNRADVMQRQGMYPPPAGVTNILGLEFSGEISALGSEVTSWKVGEKVCGIISGGSYAEYVKIRADHLIGIPNSMSMANAAGLPEAFLTAYQALIEIANIQKDELILIHAGASGVGSAAIQIAKNLGAYVICTASLAKHPYCFELGADECIDYKAISFSEYLKDKHTKGANMILDFIGASYFQKNLDSLALDGRMVMLGFLGGVNIDQLNIASIITKRLNIKGSTLRNRSNLYKKELVSGFCSKFLNGDQAFQFNPNIDKVFLLNEAAEAHRYMEENRNRGKIVLKIN